MFQGGFATKSGARDFVDGKVKTIAASRPGETPSPERDSNRQGRSWTRSSHRMRLTRHDGEAAVDESPRHLDPTAPLFPALDGGPIRLDTFRLRHWTPALAAAGIEPRRVYDCRHSFATWAVAAGVNLFYLSKTMGTSVAMIDATYGHYAPDSEDYLRGLIDRFDQRAQVESGDSYVRRSGERQ